MQTDKHLREGLEGGASASKVELDRFEITWKGIVFAAVRSLGTLRQPIRQRVQRGQRGPAHGRVGIGAGLP
jgi:hypothetical protein